MPAIPPAMANILKVFAKPPPPPPAAAAAAAETLHELLSLTSGHFLGAAAACAALAAPREHVVSSRAAVSTSEKPVCRTFARARARASEGGRA